MTTLETRYREACERADAAKGHLTITAQEAKDRVTPARIKQDIRDKAKGAIKNGAGRIVAKVQQRPVASGAAAAAFALFLARRPLTALFGRLYVRLRNTGTDNSETDDG